jgi:hypothetical protein
MLFEKELIIHRYNGIMGTSEDYCLDDDCIKIQLEIEIPEQLFNGPRIKVEIDEFYVPVLNGTVEEVQVPVNIKVDKKKGSIVDEIEVKEGVLAAIKKYLFNK